MCVSLFVASEYLLVVGLCSLLEVRTLESSGVVLPLPAVTAVSLGPALLPSWYKVQFLCSQ